MANSAMAVRYYPEIERSVAFGAITGAFTALGGPLLFSSIQLILANHTDASLQFSWDGVNVNITLLAGATFTSDIGANKQLANAMMGSAGQQFYVRYVTAPTSGAARVTSFYGAGIAN